MTSDNICDILVPEKKQQSLRTQKNRLITSEYGLANAASLIRLAAFLHIPSAPREMSRIFLFWEVFGLCDEIRAIGHDGNVIYIKGQKQGDCCS